MRRDAARDGGGFVCAFSTARGQAAEAAKEKTDVLIFSLAA
jgi:hypothetical protein